MVVSLRAWQARSGSFSCFAVVFRVCEIPSTHIDEMADDRGAFQRDVKVAERSRLCGGDQLTYAGLV